MHTPYDPKKAKAYRDAHKAEHAEYMRGWRARNPDKVRAAKRDDYRRNRPSNIRFRELAVNHLGICDVCFRPNSTKRYGKVTRLHADHDHVTGAWRGLLCSNCNTMLGLAHDDVSILRRAAEYLYKHRRDEVA